MKYLCIYDFTNVSQQDTITDDDIDAVEYGCLDVYRFHEGSYQRLIAKDTWELVESRPCPT